jgi:hypothetical protein
MDFLEICEFYEHMSIFCNFGALHEDNVSARGNDWVGNPRAGNPSRGFILSFSKVEDHILANTSELFDKCEFNE